MSEQTFIPRAPFPQRLSQAKTGKNINEMIDLFKRVEINISLLDAIKQLSAYAKFLKDICTLKSKVQKKAFFC